MGRNKAWDRTNVPALLRDVEQVEDLAGQAIGRTSEDKPIRNAEDRKTKVLQVDDTWTSLDRPIAITQVQQPRAATDARAAAMKGIQDAWAAVENVQRKMGVQS